MFFSVQMHPTIGFCSLQQACQSLLDNIKIANQKWFFSAALLLAFSILNFILSFGEDAWGFLLCAFFSFWGQLEYYYSVRQEYCFDYLRHHSRAICKRTQQLPTVLGPAVHSGKDTPHKTFQHCCATLWQSRNKWNVGSCWLKNLTSFKLCATTPNNMQQGV